MMCRNAWIVTVAAALAAAPGGCDMLSGDSGPGPEPPQVQAPPEAGGAAYLKDMVRGNDETPGPSAVDSAMVWARKYTEATEKIVQLEKDNRAMEAEKHSLEQRIAALEADLEDARAQIADADEMIRAVREENRKWKQNVLGFRQEFMDAQRAMLDYQVRIIKLLGGEPTPAGPTTRPADPLARGEEASP